MPTAVEETIATEIIARLQQITTANGYGFDVDGVEYVNRDGSDWTPKHYTLTVEDGDRERAPELDHEGNPAAIAFVQSYVIDGYVRIPDRATTTQQTLLKNLVASVQKACAEDAEWHNWDGNAIDSDWGTVEFMQTDNGTHAIARVVLLVTYRVSETDPFTARA